MDNVRKLRPGDVVALRPPAEILATLDAQGSLAGVPFMPEMLEYFGQALRVSKRVEKICDTICPIASRRMHDVVFLEDLRCDGACHGGCEAECRIYWKDSWLVRIDAAQIPAAGEPAGVAELAAFLKARIHQDESDAHAVRYRCQATEARRATEAMGTWQPGQYVREITSGNIDTWHFLRVAGHAGAAAVAAKMRRALRRPALPVGTGDSAAPAPLGLQAGDWVEVKSAEEIARTLDHNFKNRGLLFAASEMTPACGKRFRVRRRVRQIIDERTGNMLRMKHDCIALEGVVCTGDRSHRRWFCAREIYPYWREAWLRRVTPPGPPRPRQATAPTQAPQTGREKIKV
jgi:hypothetical protein